MPGFGLLGQTLGHSWSPQIHGLLRGYDYRLYEVAPEDLGAFLKTTDLDGMNVTIPYKKAVLPFCASLSESARRIGSVNTLLRTPEGWFGDNTDYDGFLAMAGTLGVSLRGKKTLVFGSGGASLAALAALSELGADPVVTISRGGPDNYENLSRHADARVVVNTTPLGMYPNAGGSPADLDGFPRLEAVLDVVYNPLRTKLLLDAEARRIPRAGGLTMLVAQARRAAELFSGAPIPEARVTEIVRLLERQMRNIILVGMPGCGKSTVGRLLAKRLGRPFFDADEELVRSAGASIPEIFAAESETGFRKRETAVLAALGQGSGAVIATGGGCVTRAENYPLLHQNGVIVWLRRELSLLPAEGRPLSQQSGAEALYAERREKYAAFADLIIENNKTPAETVGAIEEALI